MHVEKISLSVEKRIILHLLRFYQYYDAWEVPFQVSQEGIGEELGIILNNVSRAVTKLIEDGKVYSRLAHIKGLKRRRRAYFLSEKGIVLAKEIERELLEQEIVIKTKDNELKVWKIEDAIRYFLKEHFVKISLSEIVEKQNREGIVSIGAKESIARGEKFFEYLKYAPILKNFQGREKELSILREELERNCIIAVYGLPGIGKTTFVRKVIEEYRGKRNIFWYQINEWDKTKSIIFALNEFLGNRAIDALLRKKSISTSELKIILENAIKEQTFLVFDDAHNANSEVKEFFKIFIELIERIEPSLKLSIFIVSREVMEFYNRRDVLVNKTVFELYLEGMDIDSSRKIAVGMDEEEFKRLYNLCSGHPLFLEIGSKFKLRAGAIDINKFINEEILSKISTNEKEIVERFSVHRVPIPIEAFEKYDVDAVEACIKRALLKEIRFGVFSLHDTLKELIYKNLLSERKVELHLVAASWYKTKEDIENTIEAIYHYQKGDRIQEAIFLMKERFSSLVMEAEERLETLLESFKNEGEVLLMKGDLELYKGNWYKAMENYEEYLKYKTDPDVYEKLGFAKMNIKNWNETIEAYEKALAYYRQKGDKKGIAKEYINLGIVHRNKGEYDKAVEFYDLALQLLSQMNEKKGIEVVLYNKAIVYGEKGDLIKAVETISKSISLAEEINDGIGLAFCYKALGKFNLRHDKLEDAEKYFAESKELIRNEKNLLALIDYYTDIGEEYIKYGYKEKGIEEYEICAKELELRKPNTVKEKETIIEFYSLLCRRYEEFGTGKELINYREKLCKLIEEFGFMEKMGIEYIALGLAYKNSMRYNDAIAMYNKAIGIIKEYKGIFTCYYNLGKTYEA
ncbi:MAG: tetratricopeptide repeat protein, partial [Candidatus Thermoplasmatota archaeon]